MVVLRHMAQQQGAPMAPVGPSIDLTPITIGLKRLGEGQQRIADLLMEMQDGMKPEAALPIVPKPQDDFEALQVASDARLRVDAVAEKQGELAQSVGALVANQGKLADAVKGLEFNSLGAIEKLRARVEEAKASGLEGTREIARTVVWDVIKSHGPLTGGIVGLLIFIVWRDVRAKVKDGDPLIIEKMFSRINDRFDRVGDRLEDVRQRIRDRVRPDESTTPAPPTQTTAV